jgi:hypothetical protein
MWKLVPSQISSRRVWKKTWKLPTMPPISENDRFVPHLFSHIVFFFLCVAPRSKEPGLGFPWRPIPADSGGWPAGNRTLDAPAPFPLLDLPNGWPDTRRAHGRLHGSIRRAASKNDAGRPAGRPEIYCASSFTSPSSAMYCIALWPLFVLSSLAWSSLCVQGRENASKKK